MTLRRRLTLILVGALFAALIPLSATAGSSTWLETDAGTWFQGEGTVLMVGSLDAFCTRQPGTSPARLHLVETAADRTHLQHHLEGDVALYDAPDGPFAFFDTWCPAIAAGAPGPSPHMSGHGTTDIFLTLRPDALTPTSKLERAHTRAQLIDADGTTHRVHAQYRVQADFSTGEETILSEWLRID